ncbi:MAG TPA: alpha/beta hydrolase [Blastocatellia bacterium]|nr:alpha/beta hydrolase [Blastocatellia bacterium]
MLSLRILLCATLFFILAISRAGYTAPIHSAETQSSPNAALSIEGSWEGTLNSLAGRLRLVLNVSKDSSGGFKATLDSPDQGASNLPIDKITLADSFVRFEKKDIQMIFDGAISRDGTEIAGSLRQGIVSPLVLKKVSKGPATQTSAAGFTRGRVRLEPCNLPVLTKDAGCGRYEVFEDRVAKTGRKISLNILVIPAISSKPAADPVFVLAGGPGQAAVGVVKAIGNYLIKLNRDRDLVFIDQRGTGESNPLVCSSPTGKEEMGRYFTEGVNIENLRECRAQLEKNANLTLYTSAIAMDDLDEARAALGYEKINLFGGSYGTYAGFVYIRQHPDRVRTAILEGVTPVDAKIILPFAKGVEHSLERMFSDCASDPDCSKAFPTLRTEFKDVAAKLEKQPAVFESTNLLTGKRESVTLSRNVFAEQIRMMLYIPIYWRWMPLLIHEANSNNFGPFASIAHANIAGLTGQLAGGMSLSVLCAEDVPFITEEEIKSNTAGTFYGDYRARTSSKACEQWPRAKVAASFAEPVKSDIPILMITGDLDPVAPPWLAAGAARFLPNSRHISIPNTGHHFRFECTDNLIAEFLSKGSAKGLDDSCVREIERPPFITKLPPPFAK